MRIVGIDVFIYGCEWEERIWFNDWLLFERYCLG